MSVEEYGEHTRQHIAELEALLAMGDGTGSLLQPMPYTTLDGVADLMDFTGNVVTGAEILLGGSGALAAPTQIAKRKLVSQLRRKAINLPAWRRVGIDMGHVLERHVVDGPLSIGRTTFPELMSNRGIERAIREAYRYGEALGRQGDRVLIRGQSGGLTIEMWLNRATEMIESAYPIVR